MRPAVGMIGVGIMGKAMTGNLVAAGFDVVGCDPDPAARAALAVLGGKPVASAAAVSQWAEIVITSLPSAAALDAVVQDLLRVPAPGRIVAETSTLRIEDKEAARHALAHAGIVLLDCPLSGSGNQAQVRDVLVYGSGDRAAYDRCLPVFQGFSRAPHYVGPFGQGMRLKFIANLLVGIHTAAAGEAFALARAAGLDPRQVYDLVSDGAGGSRALTARKDMLIENRYEPVRTMPMRLWMKDLALIAEFATGIGHGVPLFSAAVPQFAAVVDSGRGSEDTAAVNSLPDV